MAEPTLRAQSPSEGDDDRASICFLMGVAFDGGDVATGYV